MGIQAVDERKELDATDKNLNLLNDIAMAWSVLKIPAAAEKMKTINNNIYRAFIAIDNLESCAPIKGGGDEPNAQTWASAYQDWISAFFRDRQAETISYVTKIKQTIEAAPMTLTEAGGQEKSKFGRAFDAINAAFPDEHWVLDTASLLDFSGDAIETIQKRDSPIIGFPGCDNPPPDPTNLPKLTSVPKPPAPKPTFTMPTPPNHPGGDRPNFAHTCIDKHMEGIKSTDRSILTEAISLGCGSGMIVSPVNFNMSKERISNQYPFDRVYIHMTHKYSDNQDGCMPQVLNSDPKLDSKGNWDPLAPRWGINFDDCQNTMMYIVDNCNTDTVTEKWGGAMRWNSPTGCMDFYLWIPTEPDLVPLK